MSFIFQSFFFWSLKIIYPLQQLAYNPLHLFILSLHLLILSLNVFYLDHCFLEVRIRKYFPKFLITFLSHLFVELPFIEGSQEKGKQACEDEQTSDLSQNVLYSFAFVSHNSQSFIYWNTYLFIIIDFSYFFYHGINQYFLLNLIWGAIKERGPNSVIVYNMQQGNFLISWLIWLEIYFFKFLEVWLRIIKWFIIVNYPFIRWTKIKQNILFYRKTTLSFECFRIIHNTLSFIPFLATVK